MKKSSSFIITGVTFLILGYATPAISNQLSLPESQSLKESAGRVTVESTLDMSFDELFYAQNLPKAIKDDLATLATDTIFFDSIFSIVVVSKNSALEMKNQILSAKAPTFPNPPKPGDQISFKYKETENGIIYEVFVEYTYTTLPDGRNVWLPKTTRTPVGFDDNYFDEK